MRKANDQAPAHNLLPGRLFEGLRMLSGVIAVAVLGASLAWVALSAEPPHHATLPAAIEVPLAVGEPVDSPASSASSWVPSATHPVTSTPRVVLYIVETVEQAQLASWGETEAAANGADHRYHILTSEEDLAEAALRIAEEARRNGRLIQLQVVDMREVGVTWR